MADDPITVEFSGLTFIRWENEWRLWCGCGDVIDLDEVIEDGHCVNCHVTCEDRKVDHE